MTNLSSLSKAKVCAVITVFFCLVAIAYILMVEGIVWTLLPASLSLVMALTIIYFMRKVCVSIKSASESCSRLAAGDFSSRILNIREGGDLGEFFHRINDMTDLMDAFVRESTACMQAVNENKYFRKILPDGMQGALLRGSQVMNKALINVGQKMADFKQVANDVDTSLGGVASELTKTIEQLNSTAESMGQSVQQATDKTRQAVHGSEETALSVDTISSASEEMSVSISEISHQVNKSSQISSRAVGNAEAAKIRMAELMETVEKVGQVVLLIEDIANQTNLLALNATIEAARAGEAGKGFAVVADEVKILASQTTGATEGIRKQIEDIQNATRVSSKSFDEIVSIINEINHYTSNISAAIEEQSAASREIANSSQRASEGTNAVSSNMGRLGADIDLVNHAAVDVVGITQILSGKTLISVRDLVAKMNHFMAHLNKVA